MHAENRDVAAAFRTLKALLQSQMLLQDTTVSVLITLCLNVARQPERIQELTRALRSSDTVLDVYSLLDGLSSVSQLCAASTGVPAEQPAHDMIQALFGTNGLAQMVQLPQAAAGASTSGAAGAARTHVLHQSKLLVMEFLGAAVSEFDRIASKSINKLWPNLTFENVSPDGSSVGVREVLPFNKGDAVLLSGRRVNSSDRGLEQIKQIEGQVSSGNPLRLALREPIPTVRCHV